MVVCCDEKCSSKDTLVPSRALGVAAVSFFFLGSNFFFFFFGASFLGGSTLVSAFCRKSSCSLLSFSSRSAARSSLAFALRFILAAFFLAVLPVSSASVEADADAGWWRSNDAKWFGSLGAIRVRDPSWSNAIQYNFQQLLVRKILQIITNITNIT